MAQSTVILAAGQGTRMRSALPKVLHRLAGRALLQHVIDTACQVGSERIQVVYGHGGDQVREQLSDCRVEWVEQAEQLGTGHAVAQALPGIGDADLVLILYGDVPLVRAGTLESLVSLASENSMGLLTAVLEDASGYGRIVRDAADQVVGIVEEKDATAAQRDIREINTGFMAVSASHLKSWVRRLGNANAQGEYYLTDIIAMAVQDGVSVRALQPASPDEILGVNNRSQLADLERRFQRREAEYWMEAGMTLHDPSRFDVRGNLTAGQDVEIDINVILEGDVSLGDGVFIGANTVLRNTVVEAGTRILPNCHIEDAVIGKNARIGPFARIRPETRLGENTHVGNFVEIKKSEIGKGSKVNHLTYIGDTLIGRNVNIGAGTITCNYDGAYKHQTVIGDNVFIGSDTQLVAPVKVGDGATIGAGSTITRDAPENELTLSRVQQTTKPGWKRPVKAPK